jgi:transposase
MIYVLNVLSEVAPDWVLAHVPVEWVERYGERLEHERLPTEEEERKQYANQVGADGWMVFAALDAATTPDWMKTLPAITTLHTIWEQQFEPPEQGGQWRPEPALPAAQLINSPYEPLCPVWQEKNHALGRIKGAFHPDLRVISLHN